MNDTEPGPGPGPEPAADDRTPAPTTRRSAGEQVVRDMFGEAFLRDEIVTRATAEGPRAALTRFTLEHVFGDVWSRPGLDRRSRSLVTLGILMAQGHQWELENHIVGGLANGLKPEEILEAVLHAIPYVGYPTGGQAMATATRTLSET